MEVERSTFFFWGNLMKLKTVFVIVLTLILVFLIYLSNMDQKVYYVALGDYQVLGLTNSGEITYGYTDYLKEELKSKNKLERYINGFAKDNMRITDMIHDITDNKTIQMNGKDQTLKNALIKADFVTLSIGMNDLYYKIGVNHDFGTLNYNEVYYHIDEMMIDLERLFQLLREYCKEDIIMTDFYNPLEENEKLNEILIYANERLYELASTFQIQVVKIHTLFQNKNGTITSIYPTKEEYQKISEKMKESMVDTLLND